MLRNAYFIFTTAILVLEGLSDVGHAKKHISYRMEWLTPIYHMELFRYHIWFLRYVYFQFSAAKISL